MIDCQTSGISGDKFLATLVDLGADVNRIKSAINLIPSHLSGCEKIRVDFVDKVCSGFKSTQLKVQIKEKKGHRSSGILLSSLEKCLRDVAISSRSQQFAREALNQLLESEACLHGNTVSDVHLHEAGSADTIIDILGVAVALDDLGLMNNCNWHALPIALGGGSVTFSHGTVSVPAPATLEILKKKKVLIHGGTIKTELTTPTGAALVSALIDKSVEFIPKMAVEKVGYGAGTKTFGSVPNIMRVLVGETHSNPFQDDVIVIETNVDDISGEVLGHLVNRLMLHGQALDVNIFATVTKKNRPGHVIQVIARPNQEEIIRLLMNETKSLGVRVLPCHRHVWHREIEQRLIQIDDKKHEITFKIAKNQEGEIVSIKPEFDEVVKLASNLNRPVKEILDLLRATSNDL
ncbi:MAG: nickel pincer cofactor biosynthesis protein LarC [Candidatus Helarchaeota archaeon]